MDICIHICRQREGKRDRQSDRWRQKAVTEWGRQRDSKIYRGVGAVGLVLSDWIRWFNVMWWILDNLLFQCTRNVINTCYSSHNSHLYFPGMELDFVVKSIAFSVSDNIPKLASINSQPQHWFTVPYYVTLTHSLGMYGRAVHFLL